MGLPHPAPNPVYARRAYAWTVVALLIATAVVSYTDRQVLSLLVDPIRNELGISDLDVSLLLGTAFAMIYGLAGLPLGYLSDRVSRRNLIVGGVLTWSAGTIFCALSRDFAQIFLGRIIVGLGEAALSPAAISLISDYFPRARRGAAIGAFLSGIAMGNGAAILIGGAVLKVIENGHLASLPGIGYSPWRLVLLLVGAPGFLWAIVLLIIREPTRRPDDTTMTERQSSTRSVARAGTLSLFVMLAAASLVDNAVGAWAPTLLIRNFAQDAAAVGLQLGLLLTVGFGGGVLLGGILADRTASRGGAAGKSRLCSKAGVLVIPTAVLMGSDHLALVLIAVPMYFALSGIVTAVGFSAILDLTPSSSRAFAMAVSFFLNVAIGAGLGPTAVTLAATHIFGATRTLGPPLALTAALGYAVAITAAITSLPKRRSTS